MSMQKKEFKETLDNALSKANKVVILTHANPDDDAVASILGTQCYIEEVYGFGGVVEALVEGMRVEKWDGMRGYEKIGYVDEITEEVLGEYDMVIQVDSSNYDRIGRSGSRVLQSFGGAKYCIDHHKNTPDSYEASYIHADAASNAENVYTLFFEDLEQIPLWVCEPLLLGIVGDTGSFTFIDASQTKVLEIAAQLIRVGKLNVQSIKAKYYQYPKEVFELIRVLVGNMEFVQKADWPALSRSYLTIPDHLRGLVDAEAISAAAHIFSAQYSKVVKGYTWGYVVYPALKNAEVESLKISLRSLPGGVNVCKFAQAQGNGGGHNLASGFKRAVEQGIGVQQSVESLNKEIDQFLEQHAYDDFKHDLTT
jgi:phosphoesterase RecJ-like protein